MRAPQAPPEIPPDSKVRLSPALAGAATLLFFAILLLPSLPWPSGFSPGAPDQWDEHFRDTPFARTSQNLLQRALTSTFREGNRQVHLGPGQLLFDRSALSALTGRGPLAPAFQPISAEPDQGLTISPVDAILHFARQLEEENVDLVLVPVPVKAMIEPGRTKPLRHPASDRFFAELREGGVEVLDLAAEFCTWKKTGSLFLERDTHWTPYAMERTAERVASHVRDRLSPSIPLLTRIRTVPVSHPGDLVEQLRGSSLFGPGEQVEINQVLDSYDEAPIEIHDQSASVLVLGDSFCNIYSEASLRWGEQAGFAQHLARFLGRSVDTIARNGQGVSGVRRALSERPDPLRAKEVVVWILSSRDLFLTGPTARELGLSWDQVTLSASRPPSPIDSSQAELILEGELLVTSRLPDPRRSPYPSTLLATKYRVLRVSHGTYEAPEILVFHWGYRERRKSPASRFQPGDRHTLSLLPLAAKPELRHHHRSDDVREASMIPFWAESSSPVP